MLGGKSKGFGFVHYVTDEAADKAIELLNGKLIAGKEMFVARFQKRNSSRYSGEWTNLYVRNIPADWTETKLEELFSQYGTVNSKSNTHNKTCVLVFFSSFISQSFFILLILVVKIFFFFFLFFC